MAYPQKNQNSTFYQSYYSPYSLDEYGVGCGLKKRHPSSDNYTTSNKRNRNQCCQNSHINFHRQCRCSVKLQPLCECDCYMLPSLYHKLLSAPYTTLAKTPKEKKPPKKEIQNRIVYIQRPAQTPPSQPTFVVRPPNPQNVTFNMQPQNIGRTLVNYLIPSHQVNNHPTVAQRPTTNHIQQPVVSFTSIPTQNAQTVSQPIQRNVERTSILKPTLTKTLTLTPSHSTVVNEPAASSTYSIRQTSSVEENSNTTSRNTQAKEAQPEPKLHAVAILQSKPEENKNSLSLSSQSNGLGFFLNQNMMGMKSQSVTKNISMSQQQNTQQVSFSSSVSRSEMKQIVQKSQKTEQQGIMIEQDSSNKMSRHMRDMANMNMPAIQEQQN